MAGHSKWANIKRRKAVVDAKKGQAYAKYTREIIMATKIGGVDPAGNFRLRTAIDHAKATGLPKDTIDRAIAKGAGQLAADNLENLTYEGYGPGGVAVLVEAMTDNRNRTAGDIRSYFSKYGGNLGETGSVGWMFHEKGHIRTPDKGVAEDDLLEAALDSGAEDMAHAPDEGVFDIWTQPDALNTVCQGLQARQYSVASAELTRVPENTVPVTDPDNAKKLLRLLDALESQDDVQAVHANFEMDDALLETWTPT